MIELFVLLICANFCSSATIWTGFGDGNVYGFSASTGVQTASIPVPPTLPDTDVLVYAVASSNITNIIWLWASSNNVTARRLVSMDITDNTFVGGGLLPSPFTLGAFFISDDGNAYGMFKLFPIINIFLTALQSSGLLTNQLFRLNDWNGKYFFSPICLILSS